MSNASSVRQRILAFFLENVGNVVTRDMIKAAARDPLTDEVPENWHQRLSELRTDYGYTILTNRDRKNLKPGQYLMPDSGQRVGAGRRVSPTKATWLGVLERAENRCEWTEEGI